jgi:hypothetical protein
MNAPHIREFEIRMEIWRSFVGVLKSYAVVANPTVHVHAVEDGTIGDVVIDAGAAYLSFAFDATGGLGSLRLMMASDIEAEERFELGADGTISFDGESGGVPEELDHAAIRLLGSLTRAANRDKTEALA